MMQRVLLLAFVVAVAACGPARTLPRAPLAYGDGLESSGWPLLGAGPHGSTVRFIEGARFRFGLTFRNRTAHAVTIVAVRTPQAAHALVQQESTRFVADDPPSCPHGWNCPPVGFTLGAGTSAPYVLAPHEQVGVTIGYRMGSCAQLRAGASVANRGLVVSFQYGNGSVRTERFALGYARMTLRPTPSSACDHRPHSDIAVTGPYATSSDWTIPWTAAASCARTAATRLLCTGDDTCAHGVFRSGVYQTPGKPAVRVEIDLRTKRVTVWVGVGLHGWTAFRSTYAVVTPKRFHATVTAKHRPTFRAYGAWRCATGG